MAHLQYAFSSNDTNNDNLSSSYSYIDVDESILFNKHTTSKEVLFSNNDIQIEYYPYHLNHLDYISNYIYPFWKLEFLNKSIIHSEESKQTMFNPFATWTNNDLAKHNMGLKDNTICFELKSVDITIGFCSILLLDTFDREGLNSVFNDTIYDDSLLLYNFVIEKPFRGCGYGKILFDKIINFILEPLFTRYIQSNTHYKYINLFVNKDNLSAKHIYEKKGFTYLCENPKNNQEQIYRFKIGINSS